MGTVNFLQNKLLLVAVLFAFSLSGGDVLAQSSGKPFVLGIVEEISSLQLNEKRILNIYLPDGYDKDTAHYPVIYLLDGSANEDFIHIVGIVQFMNMLGLMPNTIVVGIANVDRKRDFTFPTLGIDKVAHTATGYSDEFKAFLEKQSEPYTGHSDKFISFLEKEAQPYIENHYRVNGSKTLIGQSLGGLLATQILLKKPEMFTTYIIVSPSLWWDNESLLKNSTAFIKAIPDKDISINILVGKDEEGVMVSDATKLVEQLHNHGKPHHHNYFRILEGESHLTILHNAVYKVLMMLNTKK